MRTLLLLRHAKSSWRDAKIDDHERPLNGRGRKAADLVASWLAAEGLLPDLALVSTAVRTQETWARMLALWDRAPDSNDLRTLYLATPGRLLQAARRIPPEVRRLLLLGHNPGLEHLAEQLAGPGSDPTALARMTAKFPTAAVAIFRCEISAWDELGPEHCRLAGFETPRDLA